MSDPFGPQWGSWTVTSKKDPRWNGSGRGKGLVTGGGPPEIQAHIDSCRAKFGKQPNDLIVEFWKD